MSETRRIHLFGETGPEGHGLEIGALDSPLLRRPDHDVLYVDYASTELLRRNQYDPGVRLDDLVEVDVVWGEVPLRTAVGREVDFVVASHVIEHVPDLIGWLAELRAVLKPGGLLGLIVPDKRFTFDALRRESTLAEAVEAHLLGYRRPSLRQVFDVASLGVPVDPAGVWTNGLSPETRRREVLARLPSALELARTLRDTPRYQDAHCWVFTPASFLDLAEELANLDLFPFRIEQFTPTERGGIEFYLRLVADDDRSSIRGSIETARGTLADAPEPASATGSNGLDRNGNGRLTETSPLQAELDAVRRSTSWKVTAPLRALARLLRGAG